MELRKANLFILYDDKQMPPPNTSSEILPLTKSLLFNKLPKIEWTKNYRFTDNLGELAEFYRNNYLSEKEIIERGDFKLIEEKDMYTEFKKKHHILTLVHRQWNIINVKLYKEQNELEIPVMIISSSSLNSLNKSRGRELKGKKGERIKKKLSFMAKEREVNYFIFCAKLMNIIKSDMLIKN